MIHSMTGFGGASFRVDGVAFDVEVRSVNHRHLDARVRLPRPLASLESEVRARIQGRFSRGKVDLSVVSPDGAEVTFFGARTKPLDAELTGAIEAYLAEASRG